MDYLDGRSIFGIPGRYIPEGRKLCLLKIIMIFVLTGGDQKLLCEPQFPVCVFVCERERVLPACLDLSKIPGLYSVVLEWECHKINVDSS